MHDKQSTNILGIDPGSRAMGWGIVTVSAGSLQVVASGVLTPKKGPLPGRLGVLLLELTTIFDSYVVDQLAIESAFVHSNPRTALVLGQARGLPIALAAAREIAVHEYAPALIKRQVVGRGRASKEQVRRMIAAQLQLESLPGEDEGDALAVALTHIRLSRVATGGQDRPKTSAQLQYEAALKAAGGRRRR